MKPEVRVGQTANLVIFLGILYTVIHLVALLSNADSTSRSFGLPGLLVALVAIGLGYGIRFSSRLCLYVATALCAVVALYSLAHLMTASTLKLAIRSVLSTLTLYKLCRSIPAMRILNATHTPPIRTSRYGDYFLRRWKK